MSGGRFELGIGAGAFWDAVAGMGGPRRTAGESLDALEEAIPIIRAALDVGPERRVVRGDGPHYPVPGYPPGPPPAHHVEIWVGAYRARGLRLIARMADGWVPSVGYVGVDGMRDASARLDEELARVGRDPGEIRRVVNVGGTVTDGAVGPGPLDGPVERWADALAAWNRDMRIDTFVYWPPDTAVHAVERFALDVVPAVRDAIARS
jgi:alkanesulfonate monooxygenase SsuD/methylene tetrahydromethanopterin reductase-like flavin-dependent oxidoreductase (luciferase family)